MCSSKDFFNFCYVCKRHIYVINRFLVIGFLSSLIAVACGGGGGGGQQIGGSTDTMLTGQVFAPNGALASLENKRFGDELLDVIWPPVLADFNGISPVSNTAVELVRLNLTGSVDGVPIATTTSNGGGVYSFNLTDLGLAPETTLAVRVGSGFLRAFVTGTDIDITVESETVFQRVVTAVGGTSELTNYTPAEIEALVSGLRRVTSGTISGGGNINDAVTDATQDLSVNNSDLNDFANSAATVGEESRGPGDNNYVPLTQGVIYTYTGSVTVNGGMPTVYTNTTTINGTQSVQGVTTTRFESTNLFDQGTDVGFIASNLLGVFDYSLITEGFATQPVVNIRFPNVPGQVTENIVNGDLILPFDFEAFALGSLTVPAGMFTNVLHIRATLDSGTPGQIVENVYYAPNIGLIQRDLSDASTGEVFSEQLMVMPTGL